jgi:hypothetical protein
VDDELLAAARQAQERLIDAERDAEVARADFHRAVRRLHLHGGSLRELASALGLSHQRVHQIVEAAGGSRRWVRRRAPRQYQATCTFCGQQREAQNLIAGPGVHICEECATLAQGVLAAGQAAETGLGLIRPVPEDDKRERCSFCGKYRPQCTGLAAAQPVTEGKTTRHYAICAECLTLCAEIIAERPA